MKHAPSRGGVACPWAEESQRSASNLARHKTYDNICLASMPKLNHVAPTCSTSLRSSSWVHTWDPPSWGAGWLTLVYASIVRMSTGACLFFHAGEKQATTCCGMIQTICYPGDLTSLGSYVEEEG